MQTMTLNPTDHPTVLTALDLVHQAQFALTAAEVHVKSFRYGDQSIRAKLAEQDHGDAVERLAQATAHAVAMRKAAVKEILTVVGPEYRAAVRALVNAIEREVLPKVLDVMSLRMKYQQAHVDLETELGLENWPTWLRPDVLQDKVTLLRQNTGL